MEKNKALRLKMEENLRKLAGRMLPAVIRLEENLPSIFFLQDESQRNAKLRSPSANAW